MLSAYKLFALCGCIDIKSLFPCNAYIAAALCLDGEQVARIVCPFLVMILILDLRIFLAYGICRKRGFIRSLTHIVEQGFHLSAYVVEEVYGLDVA